MCRLLAVLLLLPGLAVAQEKKGTQYAFLVGCAGYSETQLKPLPYTVNDVEQFRQALLETGFEADNIKTLHDKQPLRFAPERKKILKEFANLLAGLRPEDTVVVALSGHGVHFKKDATGYFCPLDAELKDKTTLIPFEGKDGLFDQLKACKAKRKLMIVNACRNDPASDRAQAAEKIDLDDHAPEVVPEGIAAIYSCREGQKSYYDAKRERGIFFEHVTKAWRGEYATGQDHTTIEDFFREVTARTKADVDKTYGESQVPEVKREYKEMWRVPTSGIAADLRAYEWALKAAGDSARWVDQTGPKRFQVWCSSAEGGNATAMLLTGRCYHLGAGTGKDYTRAAGWYRKAAELGNSFAMNNLGHCYENGQGVDKDQKQAVEWYRKAAGLGNPSAMANFGVCYENGQGVDKDQKQAVEWYRKAAGLGNSSAMASLGHCYENGQGVDKDQKQAVEWYRKAAGLGNSSAMASLGVCYVNGQGVDKDQKQAVEWFRKAAGLGNPFAMANLGVCYEKSWGVDKDQKQAVEWFRKAADLGDLVSMHNLGIFYKNGWGIDKDQKQAVEWFRKAADLGDLEAMNKLGVYYENGEGVDKDPNQAVYWYRKAAKLGNQNAKDALKRLGVSE